MSRLITLTRGQVAVVDEADFTTLSLHKWHARRRDQSDVRWAACRAVYDTSGRQTIIYMHREVMRPPAGMLVDHINGDPLDNRRVNLRLCSASQNAMNTRIARAKSGYRGVVQQKGGTWRARIGIKGRFVVVGSFATAAEAALAYDRAALELHGEFASLNLPHLARAA